FKLRPGRASTPFPYTTLVRSQGVEDPAQVSSRKIRVAIIGVGNCASSLVQGVEYYRHADPNDFVPGLMHVDLGGYHVGDIEFSADRKSTRLNSSHVKISYAVF